LKKKAISLLFAGIVAAGFLAAAAGCGSGERAENAGSTETESRAEMTGAGAGEPNAAGAELAESDTRKIIAEAQGMELQELAEKAIGESGGSTFRGIGTDSRTALAMRNFVKYLKTLDPMYSAETEWYTMSVPSAVSALNGDLAAGADAQYSVVLLQDMNRVNRDLADPALLDTFIPKTWAEDLGTEPENYRGYLTLMTAVKPFMQNSAGGTAPVNCWDFAADNARFMMVDADQETVDRNFLLLLTRDGSAAKLREAFEALDEGTRAAIQPEIDSAAQEASELGLGEDGRYALAYIRRLLRAAEIRDADGPICDTLAGNDAAGASALIAYDTLRAVDESASKSVKNIAIAAYGDGYQGIGGFTYRKELFVSDRAPLPWTACAFAAWLCSTPDGFSAFGRDIGAYAADTAVAHENENTYTLRTGGENESGEDEFPAKNDRGLSFWETGGNAVAEDLAEIRAAEESCGAWLDGVLGK
jgi:hypothetical protein